MRLSQQFSQIHTTQNSTYQIKTEHQAVTIVCTYLQLNIDIHKPSTDSTITQVFSLFRTISLNSTLTGNSEENQAWENH